MPSREPELYKDKIEVSLDGRQIFYLFFGGAAIVGLVFVLGVMVGRRVEARGHLDRADTQSTSDPLAALDRLERTDSFAFRGALTGSAAPVEVDKAIAELERKRAAAGGAHKVEPVASSAGNLEARPRVEAKPVKPEPKDAKEPGKDSKAEAKADKLDAPVTRSDSEHARADKHDGDKKSKHRDDAAADRSEGKGEKADVRRSDSKDKPVTRPEARLDGKAEGHDGKAEGHDGKAEARAEPKAEGDGKADHKASTKASAEGKARFTLQLSSFQDRTEADAFLAAMKTAGYQPYVTEADVSGKGTFYRVRLGSYRSLEAANDAKAEYEKSVRKTAQVTRL